MIGLTPKEAERKRVSDFLLTLRFDCSSVSPKLIEGFSLRETRIEWLEISHFSMMEDVLLKMDREDKVPVHPHEFISEISRLDEIFDIRVCLFQREGSSKWIALVASQGKKVSQRSLVELGSGDGWATCCCFAVKPKI